MSFHTACRCGRTKRGMTLIMLRSEGLKVFFLVNVSWSRSWPIMHLVEWQREVFPSLLYSIILHNHQSSPKTRLGRLTGSRWQWTAAAAWFSDCKQHKPEYEQSTDRLCMSDLSALPEGLPVEFFCSQASFCISLLCLRCLQAEDWTWRSASGSDMSCLCFVFFPGWMIYFVFVCRIFFLNGLYPTRCFKHQRRSFWARSIKLSKTSEKHKVKLQTSHKTKLTTNFKSREPGRC